MGKKGSGKYLVSAGQRASTLSEEVRNDVIQLDTSARKDVIVCPGTDTKNFEGTKWEWEKDTIKIFKKNFSGSEKETQCGCG